MTLPQPCFFPLLRSSRETTQSSTKEALSRQKGKEGISHVKNKHGKIIPMPSNLQSCLLVKISSSHHGLACPPVIIKEKDGSRRAQQRHQHASLLCSERSTFGNPPAPDGPIYCTKWIVFGLHTVLSNLHLIPSLLFLFFFFTPAPRTVSSVLSGLRNQQNCLDALRLVKKEAQRVANKVTHYAGLMRRTPAVRLKKLFFFFSFLTSCFCFTLKKEKEGGKKTSSSSPGFSLGTD